MSFKRTQRHLERMERGELTTCELFACFYDLCEDMKAASGGPISKLPTGEPDKLVRPLSRIAKLVTTTAVQVEDPNWKQTVQDLAQENEAIRLQCDAASEDLEELEKLREEKKVLLDSQAALLSGQDEKRREIDDLEEQLKKSQSQVDQLVKELARYESQKKQEEELKRQQEQKAADLAERKRLQDLLIKCQMECAEAKKARDSMAKRVADTEAERSELDRIFSELNDKVAVLDTELSKYADKRTEKERLEALREQKAQDLECFQNLKNSTEELQGEIEELQKKLTQLDDQKTTLEKQQNVLIKNLNEREKALNAVKNAISPEKLSRQRARLDRLTRALDGWDEECEALCGSLPELSNCKNCSAVVRTLLNDIEAKLSSCERNYNEIITAMEKEK